MSYRKFVSLTVALILIGAGLASAREYKILYPNGRMEDAVKVGKMFKAVSDEDGVPQIASPGGPSTLAFGDTIIYDDGTPYYYMPNRAAYDTAVVWFTPPASCSLVAIQYLFYSATGSANGGVWDALSEYVPGGPEFFDGAGGGDSALGSAICYPFPVTSGGAQVWTQVDLTPFCGGYIDMDTFDFFAGFVWTAADLPQPMGDQAGSYVPARSQMWRASRGGWYNVGTVLDMMIRAVVIVYGNPGPEIAHNKLPDTYSTAMRTVDATITDMPNTTVTLARLYWRVNAGAWDSTDMSGTYPNYSGTLPGAAVGDFVEYYMRACDEQPVCVVAPPSGEFLPYSYTILAGTQGACVLYVDEGDATDEGLAYTTALDNALAGTYDVWDVPTNGTPDASVINFGYQAIFWSSYAGGAFGDAVGAGDIQTYLDNRGNLWVAGQDIPDFGLGYGYGNFTPVSGEFAYDYLHIASGTGDFFPSGDTACEVLYGATGDTITDPFVGGFNYWPTWMAISDNWRGVVTLLAGADPIIYDINSNISGLKVDTTYRLIFNYWHLGAMVDVCDTLGVWDEASATTMIRRALEWFGCPVTGVEEGDASILPTRFGLNQNSPNPVRSETEIQFGLPQVSDVTIRVYDITGSLVKELHNGEMKAGSHAIHWDLRNETGFKVSSGIYFYRLTAGGYSATRKLVVLR